VFRLRQHLRKGAEARAEACGRLHLCSPIPPGASAAAFRSASASNFQQRKEGRMKGAPPTRHGQISDMQVIINCVDQRGREMDERWGIGRLPMLVPIEWAERFHAQHKLFNAAVWEFNLKL